MCHGVQGSGCRRRKAPALTRLCQGEWLLTWHWWIVRIFGQKYMGPKVVFLSDLRVFSLSVKPWKVFLHKSSFPSESSDAGTDKTCCKRYPLSFLAGRFSVIFVMWTYLSGPVASGWTSSLETFQAKAIVLHQNFYLSPVSNDPPFETDARARFFCETFLTRTWTISSQKTFHYLRRIFDD